MRVSGIASQLDWEALISKLMAVERRPVVLMSDRRAKLEAAQAAWLDVNTRLGELQTQVFNLKQASAFGGRRAESGDEDVVVATAGTGASPASYSITVDRLAQAHKVASDAQADITSPLGLQGTFQVNGVGVTVGTGDSLSALRDRINAAGAGVTASLVGTTLVLTRSQTGATPIALVDDPATDVLTQLGLLDASDQIKRELVAAQDAAFTVDTLSFTRGSNAVSDVIYGVTFTLKGQSAAGVSLTISPDLDQAVTAVNDFVAKYNAALDAIAAKLGKGGELQGDAALIGIQWSLRRLVSEPVAGLPATLDRLSQVGVAPADTAGHLAVDEEDLRAALEANPAGVAAIFQDEDGGVAVRLYNNLKALTQAGGIILSATDSLQDNMERIDDDIRNLEARLQLREQELYRQYTQMEVTISRLQNQSAWLAAQSSSWLGSQKE